jgi:hypothetical protein
LLTRGAVAPVSKFLPATEEPPELVRLTYIDELVVKAGELSFPTLAKNARTQLFITSGVSVPLISVPLFELTSVALISELVCATPVKKLALATNTVLEAIVKFITGVPVFGAAKYQISVRIVVPAFVIVLKKVRLCVPFKLIADTATLGVETAITKNLLLPPTVASPVFV